MSSIDSKFILKDKILAVVISFFLLATTSCSKAVSIPEVNDVYFPVFEKSWQLYTLSANGGWKNNFNGRFSWDDSYALEGLIYHYERSKDKRYLDSFMKVSIAIFNSTDENLKIYNKYRGNRIIKGWSTKRYTHDSSFHVFGVTNAMILYPIIKMYNLIKNENQLNETYKQFFVKVVSFSILEFDEVNIWDWSSKTSESGFFHDSYYSAIGTNTPVNQYARIGSYAIELYKATGVIKYFEYAKKVANYVKQNLIYQNDYFYWNYSINIPPTILDRPDDLGHSILVVQFIVNCYKNNIVFEINHIKSLVQLFKKQLFIPNAFSFREYLDGNSISSDPIISHYYLLSEFSNEIYQALTGWLNQQAYQVDTNSFLNHFGNKLILMEAMELYYKRFSR